MIEIQNLIYNEDAETKIFASENFNFILDKETGSSYSWGKTKDDTPLYNPISPEEIHLILNDDYVFDKNIMDRILNLNIETVHDKNITSVSCINVVNVNIMNVINEQEVKKLFNYFESLKIIAFLNINFNNSFSLKNVFKLKFLNVKNVILNVYNEYEKVIESIKLLIENEIFVKCKYNLTNENFDNYFKIISNNEYPQSLLSIVKITKNFKKNYLNKLTEYLKTRNLISFLIERTDFNKYKNYEMKSFQFKPALDSCVIDLISNKICPSFEFGDVFVNINDVKNISNYWNSDAFNKFRKPIILKLENLKRKETNNEK